MIAASKKGVAVLDGQILYLLGSMGVKDIEFWLQMEKYYLEEVLAKEDIYKIIECLVGITMVKRGSTAFLTQLQDRILSKNPNFLKTKDFTRAFFALSLMPLTKVHPNFLNLVTQ